MSLCKKHGKPRTVIYERKMPKGGVFSIVGCQQCADEAMKRIDQQDKKPERKPTASSNAGHLRRY